MELGDVVVMNRTSDNFYTKGDKAKITRIDSDGDVWADFNFMSNRTVHGNGIWCIGKGDYFKPAGEYQDNRNETKSMEKYDAIIIERVGNGYIVRPGGEHEYITDSKEVLVFQKIGNTYSTDTLLSFIEGHFSEGKQ